ncbi:MAG TPA: CBS domain-containing protein [Anaerolineaceae bacterium]|nr:CBS domain-containing protein [Anaerolineaceae bacterium]
MTTVRQILRQKSGKYWYVSIDANIKDALDEMAKHDIGAVLVLEDEKLVGIFSERDFAREVAEQGEVNMDTPITYSMTNPVYYVTPDHTTEECMALMTDKHFRHLPVIDQDKLVGVISIGDVVKDIISDRESMIKGLENYITGHEFRL